MYMYIHNVHYTIIQLYNYTIYIYIYTYNYSLYHIYIYIYIYIYNVFQAFSVPGAAQLQKLFSLGP